MLNKTARIHSLDSLRAIMMMLGLVLHSTEIYLVGGNDPWPKDVNSTSHFLGYLENVIHMFRMPIFFVMAGFFASLLYYERGSIKMVKNRISRIVLPFVVFLFILAPIVVFSLYYSTALFAGSEDAFGFAISKFSSIEDLIPISTFHLWFLYYLILITLLTYLLAKLFQRLTKVSLFIKNVFHNIIKRPIGRVLWFALFIFVLLVINWDLSGPTPLSFEINIEALLFYSFFYLLGWMLYKTKDVLESFLKYDWLLVALAFVIFSTEFLFYDEIDDIVKGVMSAFVISMFIFGITGLFIRYFSNHSAKMRYVSDASYWVYLIHIPFTIIIPGLIAGWELPGEIKFLITLLVSTIICFTTYHYLVRSTFIGKFLNGRKY
tara:strand:- start:3306 stop:4436 length:1131 start_codon:yes stop_codon:yes gene_type:complete